MTGPALPVFRPDWQREAARRDLDTALFFVDGPPPASVRAICRGCSVRTECLEHALSVPEYGGIWAGLSERARRARRPDPPDTPR